MPSASEARRRAIRAGARLFRQLTQRSGVPGDAAHDLDLALGYSDLGGSPLNRGLFGGRKLGDHLGKYVRRGDLLSAGA
jgi:hypothetical protein